MYSDGNVMYSYGSHFVIARIVENKKGQEAYLINTQTASNTTSKQQWCVRNAIPGNAIRFNVEGANITHKENIKHYISEMERLSLKITRARSRKDELISERESVRQECIQYMEFFSVNIRLNKIEKQILSGESVTTEQFLEAKKRRQENNKASERRRNKKAKEKAEKILHKWMKGENVRIPYGVFDTAFLRINGEIVETSQSVAIPIKEARILWAMIKRGKNVVGHKVDGMYTVIKNNGELVVGCHRIERSEIERFVKEYNW